MRLLVTRPQPEAAETAGKLVAMGHTVTIEPLLRIVLAEPPRDLPEPAAIVVTSRNGVRALAGWPQAERWRDTPLLAAGAATAAEARAAGFRKVTAGSGDAAALAERVRQTLPPGVGPILYVAARDRAGALADALAARGHAVCTVEAYRAEKAERLRAPVLAALTAGDIDGALFYSRRTAETFRDLVAARRIRLAHVFALSPQVAEPVAGLAADLHIASAPDETSLFKLIPPP